MRVSEFSLVTIEKNTKNITDLHYYFPTVGIESIHKEIEIRKLK